MKNNEEIKIEETTIEEMNYPVETENYMEPEIEVKGGKGKLIAAGLTVVGLGVAAFAFKKKDQLAAKRAEKAAKKLEKMGYTVISPEEIIEEKVYDFDESLENKEVVKA